MDEYMKNE